MNYVLFGLMMRLCHDFAAEENSSSADWFSPEEMLELIYMHKNKTFTQAANFQASNEWALVGYRAGPIRPTPPGDRSVCKGRCSKPYDGPGFTVFWYPIHIRPGR